MFLSSAVLICGVARLVLALPTRYTPDLTVRNDSTQVAILAERAATVAQWTDPGRMAEVPRPLLPDPKGVHAPNTPDSCVDLCAGGTYEYARVEARQDCFCSNTVVRLRRIETMPSESSCDFKDTGDAVRKCRGAWKLNVYAKTKRQTDDLSGIVADPAPVTSPSLVSSNAAHQAVYGTSNGPSSANPKFVWAHQMVGNTYLYTVDTWIQQMSLAKGAGIDGFALNMGRDSWESARVQDAYKGAQVVGGFVLFLSLDVSSLPCASAEDAATFADLVKSFAGHPVQARYAGFPVVSTFAGDGCTFGQGDAGAGWRLFRSLAGSIYFIPALFTDVNSFGGSDWCDGVFAWNSGWSTAAGPVGAEDGPYLSALDGRGYMAAVSPFFFTYYGPSSYNKNWIYPGDDWLLPTRFEQLIASRDRFDMVQVISWNDCGESHYIGPVGGDQPGSSGWTAGMPHTALLSLVNLYARAFKTGNFPGVYDDHLWVWSRPHPAGATASNPTNSRPSGWDTTQDNLYALVTLSSPARVALSSGSNTAVWDLPAGLTKLLVASAPGAITATVTRGDASVKQYDSSGSFSYTDAPTDYNFNYFVAEA